MRYYFSAQITVGSTQAKARYARLLAALEKNGHINTNYLHLAEDDPQRVGAEQEINSGSVSQFDYLLKLLDNSDALICDVTEQSSTVGFQIMHALNNKIPCLAILFKNESPSPESKPSIIFSKSYSGLLRLVTIDSWDELESAITSFYTDLVNKPFKFNFYIPLNLHNELARAATRTNRTKSELVRDIISDYLERAKED